MFKLQRNRGLGKLPYKGIVILSWEHCISDGSLLNPEHQNTTAINLKFRGLDVAIEH